METDGRLQCLPEKSSRSFKHSADGGECWITHSGGRGDCVVRGAVTSFFMKSIIST